MANPEHLKILKQDVEVWNQWRQENSAEMIDLRGADLRGADLPRANLSKANLSDTNLRGADLHGANLFKAALFKANLSRAVLSRADLREADLRGAELNGTSFYMATLFKANLNRAVLSRAVLSGADLREGDLREAILYRASLIGTNLSEANLTGAYLFGTVRDDWIIDGIKCEYVSWDPRGKKRTPKNRNFNPGEFEALYKYLPTIEYYFEHGFTPLDPIIMNQIVQAIDATHPEYELRIDSFRSREQPCVVLTVAHKDYAEEALKQITTNYESRIAALEGKQAQLMQMVSMLLENPHANLIPLDGFDA